MRTRLYVAVVIAFACSANTVSAADDADEGKQPEQHFTEQLNEAFEKKWQVEVFILNVPPEHQPLAGWVEQKVRDNILVLQSGPRRYVHLAVDQIQVLIVTQIERNPPGTKVYGAEGPAETPRASVEIRRAEAAPGEGLTEAVVGDTTEKVYLHKAAELVTADIAHARVVVSEFGPKYSMIEFTFTKEGAKKFEMFSKDWLLKPVAILINGKVLTAPVLRSTISEQASITTRLTREQAEALVKQINGD